LPHARTSTLDRRRKFHDLDRRDTHNARVARDDLSEIERKDVDQLDALRGQSKYATSRVTKTKAVITIGKIKVNTIMMTKQTPKTRTVIRRIPFIKSLGTFFQSRYPSVKAASMQRSGKHALRAVNRSKNVRRKPRPKSSR